MPRELPSAVSPGAQGLIWGVGPFCPDPHGEPFLPLISKDEFSLSPYSGQVGIT